MAVIFARSENTDHRKNKMSYITGFRSRQRGKKRKGREKNERRRRGGGRGQSAQGVLPKPAFFFPLLGREEIR